MCESVNEKERGSERERERERRETCRELRPLRLVLFPFLDGGLSSLRISNAWTSMSCGQDLLSHPAKERTRSNLNRSNGGLLKSFKLECLVRSRLAR